MELTDLKGVGGTTEDKLNSVSIDTIDDLASADADQLEKGGISEKKAEKLIRRAKKNTVIIQTGTEVQEEFDARKPVSTGMDKLDDVLGGGWREYNIVAISGEPSTGKTQICFQSLVSAVETTGRPAVYIETEKDRYSPKRLEQLADDPETVEQIHRVPAYGLEQQRLAYDSVRDSGTDYSLVVLDSFNARFRIEGKFDSRSTFSERSAEMGRHIRGLEAMAEKLSCPVLVTAQVYGNPDSYGPNTNVYGGELFKHTVNFFVATGNGQGDLHKLGISGHPEIPETEFEMRVDTDGLTLLSGN